MRLHGHMTRGWRAGIGVFVLYALVLQALLGGVAAVRMSVQAPGVLCLGDAAADEERDGHAGDADCCSALCRGGQAAVSDANVCAFRPIRRSPTRERAWRARSTTGPPAPAHASARPRAPPAVA